MTSHQLAKQLLEGPDLIIVTPSVVKYSDDENAYKTPLITQDEGTDANDTEIQFLCITPAKD